MNPIYEGTLIVDVASNRIFTFEKVSTAQRKSIQEVSARKMT